MRENGISVVISGLKQQVLQVIQRTGRYAEIGANNLFRTEDQALEQRVAAAAGQRA